jgi:hypothetical protein
MIIGKRQPMLWDFPRLHFRRNHLKRSLQPECQTDLALAMLMVITRIGPT